ncbi:MAG: TrbI/VirB10 family protein, partial [Candidatus Ornithospirochaeta sp.]
SVLLIPKGTRLIATYDSSVSWGQSRALVAWTQMVRPDGFVLKLPGLPGIDAQGYSGYQDKVDNHFWSMLGAAMLASLLDLTVDEVIIQSQNAGVSNAGLTAIDSFTGTVQTAGQKYLSKVIERQPTLRVRPGRKISLLVTDTLTLTPYKEVNR